MLPLLRVPCVQELTLQSDIVARQGYWAGPTSDGLTFYQAGFDNNDRTTILQVVRNPSWLLPYIACILMGLGLTVQFGIHLFAFVSKRRASA